MRSIARRWTTAVTMVAALALAASACGNDAEPTAQSSGGNGTSLQKLSVVVNNTSTALAIPVADRKGFFEKHGLDVEWKNSTGTISSTMATLGHQNDVVFASPTDLITARAEGMDVVQVNGAAVNEPSNSLAAFVVAKESGITSYGDLSGKTVGSLSLTSGIHYALVNILKENGVDPNSIKWVTASPPQMPDLLKAGRIDAAEEVKPFDQLAVANGAIDLGDPFLQAVGDAVYQVVYVAQGAWANDNEELVLAFGKALNDAADWMTSNPDEARAMMGEHTGLSGPLLEKSPIPNWHFSTTGDDLKAVHHEKLQRWIDVMNTAGASTKQVTADDLLPTWAK